MSIKNRTNILFDRAYVTVQLYFVNVTISGNEVVYEYNHLDRISKVVDNEYDTCPQKEAALEKMKQRNFTAERDGKE